MISFCFGFSCGGCNVGMKMRLMRASFWFQHGGLHVDSGGSKMINIVVFFNNLCDKDKFLKIFTILDLDFSKLCSILLFSILFFIYLNRE